MNKVINTSSTELVLKVETHDLTPMQVRLLKHAHTLLVHVLAAEDETEYFEASAQLLKQALQLVKNANFPTLSKDGIPYGEQAVEYALEMLTESLGAQGLSNLDN
jgi:hypothetical protein